MINDNRRWNLNVPSFSVSFELMNSELGDGR